jgi:Tol biopolymer transport system component
MNRILVFFFLASLPATFQAQQTEVEPIHYKKEKNISNVRQLTFGGNNAEAYWSPDGKMLIFQSDNTKWGVQCDQIFTLKVEAPGDSTRKKMISTGNGRTTCSWFMPNGQDFIYASTHQGDLNCPPVPEKKPGHYVWPLYDAFEIYVASISDGTIKRQLTQSPRYDAEATISPKGDKIVFTSLRNGDLDLYTMNLDGTNVKQITSTLGYDGGATFSPDGTKIVWRASRPKTLDEITKYRDLLNQDLVEPSNLEIYIANVDGSDVKQLTNLGNANWSPTFTPDGKSILFCSNYKSNIGFPFNLYLVNIETLKVTQITFDTEFDSFPMFSPDGKKLVWCSNRNNGRTRDTNIFIADWKQ